METEVGVAVAATAAVLSPRARNVVRQGAVYGLAGAMKAGDAVWGAARGAVRGVSGNGSAPAERKTPAQRTRTSSSRARRG